MEEREYRLKDESQIITPSLIYYKEMVEENIRLSIEIAGDVNRLWPHIKTVN